MASSSIVLAIAALFASPADASAMRLRLPHRISDLGASARPAALLALLLPEDEPDSPHRWLTRAQAVGILMVTFFYFSGAAHFYQRGWSYRRGIISGTEATPQRRDMRYHTIFISAVLVMGTAMVMVAIGVPHPKMVWPFDREIFAWTDYGRGLSAALIVFAFNQLSGRSVLLSFLAFVLALVAFTLVGSSPPSKEQRFEPLIWCAVAAAVEGLVLLSLGVHKAKRPMWNVLDFAVLIMGLQLVTFVVSQTFVVLEWPYIAVARHIAHGFFDILFVVGCGHLVLKPERETDLLDEGLRHTARL